jgi:hypothetical protein
MLPVIGFINYCKGNEAFDNVLTDQRGRVNVAKIIKQAFYTSFLYSTIAKFSL